MSPRWTILIATLGRREVKLRRLLSILLPQVTEAAGQVEVLAYWNNGERPIGDVRQDLLDVATGEYVSFIDDDDEVPANFVETILPLLDGVDYIGWRMQCWVDGRKLEPTYHSLRYTSWHSDQRGHYRDLSHLNPIKRELALLGSYRQKYSGEDVSWASQIRATKRVQTEHFIDECMYMYRFDRNDSVQTAGHRRPAPRRSRRTHRTAPKPTPSPVTRYVRPVIDHPHFQFIDKPLKSPSSSGEERAWRDHLAAWSTPPVDDVGYISSAELLTRTDADLREVIEKMRAARYNGWRNHDGLWRDVMGLDELAGRDILDFGCGVGVEALELLLAGNRIHLADIVESNIHLAVRVLSLYNAKSAYASSWLVDNRPPYFHAPPELVDVFYCNGVLHHIPWAREIMQRAHDVLRPDGEVRLMVYSDEGWRIATGTKPPADVTNHPKFMDFVRLFDAVGHYADWYSQRRLEQRFGDLFTIERCEYLTPDRRYLGAVLRKR